MEIRKRLFAATGLLALGAATLSGCGPLGSTFEDDTAITEQITAVRLDNGNGAVTLNGDGDASEVSVHRRVKHQGSRPEDPTHQVEDGVLVLRGCGRNCSVQYTVDLPAGLPVSGETSNGAIELSAVGDVDVRTSNGAITLDGATGPVVLRTSNGKIDVTLDTPQDVQARTSNGAITVTVPDEGFQISTQTDNGATEIRVAEDPAADHRLDLSTSNGAITVQPA